MDEPGERDAERVIVNAEARNLGDMAMTLSPDHVRGDTVPNQPGGDHARRLGMEVPRVPLSHAE